MARGIRDNDRPSKPDITIKNVSIKRESEKAILVILEDAKEIWLPRSQIRAGGTAQKAGDKGSVIISHWIAGEKSLLGDGGEDGEGEAGDA